MIRQNWAGVIEQEQQMVEMTFEEIIIIGILLFLEEGATYVSPVVPKKSPERRYPAVIIHDQS